MLLWVALGLAGLARSDDRRFVFRIRFPLDGVANVIPVDVAVPGCPPTPTAIMQGILTAISMTKSSA